HALLCKNLESIAQWYRVVRAGRAHPGPLVVIDEETRRGDRLRVFTTRGHPHRGGEGLRRTAIQLQLIVDRRTVVTQVHGRGQRLDSRRRVDEIAGVRTIRNGTVGVNVSRATGHGTAS